MDIRINELKINFTKILDLKNENVKTFVILEEKIIKLKDFYSEFVKNNKDNLFVFGLDSFHFQGKLIDIEYEDMLRLYSAITNRIYCEYFKLYKIIVKYILENVTEQKIIDLINVNNHYPIYKDLEPFKKYDFEIIQSIHELIVILLNSIYGFLLNKENELKIHQIKNNIGLNIDNFVNTFNFNIVIVREQLILFISYIEFFHKLHLKYLKRFTTKMQIFFGQINNDIKFEDTTKLNKHKRNSILETIADENMDDNILLELKNSINGKETPTDVVWSDDPKSTSTEGTPMAVAEVVNLQNIFLQIDDWSDPKLKATVVSEAKSDGNPKAVAEGFEVNVSSEDDVSILTSERSEAEDEIETIKDVLIPESPSATAYGDPSLFASLTTVAFGFGSLQSNIIETIKEDEATIKDEEEEEENINESVKSETVIKEEKKKRAYKPRKKNT